MAKRKKIQQPILIEPQIVYSAGMFFVLDPEDYFYNEPLPTRKERKENRMKIVRD